MTLEDRIVVCPRTSNSVSHKTSEISLLGVPTHSKNYHFLNKNPVQFQKVSGIQQDLATHLSSPASPPLAWPLLPINAWEMCSVMLSFSGNISNEATSLATFSPVLFLWRLDMQNWTIDWGYDSYHIIDWMELVNLDMTQSEIGWWVSWLSQMALLWVPSSNSVGGWMP